MKIHCPKCQREVPAADVNVGADVVFCRACNEGFLLSDLVDEGYGDAEESLPAEAPRGAWFTKNFDGFEVGATTRSAAAFFLVPFMCVWSGFSLGGIYGTQIYKGQFSLMQSLFGIPFALGTLLFGSIAVMAVCGKVVVAVRGGQGTIFTGVGSIGWRRRFDPLGVERVKEQVKASENGKSGQIVLEGAKNLTFGTGLNDERRRFMVQVLRAVLVKRPGSQA